MKAKISLIAAYLLMGAGCKSSEVIPGSERVRIFEAEPKGCLYVGEVSSVQEEATIGTLETQMDLATRIDMRNKAHSLGGNILVFLKGKNTNTLPGSAPAGKASAPSAAKTAEDSSSASADMGVSPGALVFIGTVFKCPSSVLNQ